MAAKKRVTKSTVAKNVKASRNPRIDRRVEAAEDKAASIGKSVRNGVATGVAQGLSILAVGGLVTLAVGRGLFRGLRG